jgi:hypothetical protein
LKTFSASISVSETAPKVKKKWGLGVLRESGGQFFSWITGKRGYYTTIKIGNCGAAHSCSSSSSMDIINTRTLMNDLTLRVYLKNLLGVSIIWIICLMIFIIGYGHRGEYLPIQAMTIFIVPLAMIQHCIMLFTLGKSAQSFKLSILTGFFSGTILALVVRVGLGLNYLLWSSNRNIGTLITIFGDSWQIYLWMGLLGIVCMLVDPFLGIVLHKDLFRNKKLSLYSPSALFLKFVLRKDPSNRNNTKQ